MKTNLGWHIIGLNQITGEMEEAQVMQNVKAIRNKELVVVQFQDGTIASLPQNDVFFMPDMGFASDE